MAKIKGAPAPHKGHAAGSTDIEKAASQLVSDVKYKVKKELSGATHMNPAQVASKYLQKLGQSAKAGTPPAVIALARKKLSAKPVKEEVMNSVDPKDMATDSVANALYKVFVEKKEVNLEQQIAELKEAYSKVNRKGERLYHVIVTDKKTGNTYTRDATREKIAELRANPNIASVEMSERKLDSEKEKTKGANTARVKAGKGLDPVGKEDGDVDNDGDKDKSDDYLMKRRSAVGAAIAKRGGVKEEFIADAAVANSDKNEKEIGIMKGKNTVKINPELPGSAPKSMTGRYQVAHYDMQGNQLSESEMKLAKMIQEKMNLAKARMGDVVTDFYGSDAPQFKGQMAIAAKLGAERKAGMKEAVEVEMDKKPKLKKSEGGCEDSRAIPTAVNLAKNKLRAMGLKMDYQPEGEVIGENDALAYMKANTPNLMTGKTKKPKPTAAQRKAAQQTSMKYIVKTSREMENDTRGT